MNEGEGEGLLPEAVQQIWGLATCTVLAYAVPVTMHSLFGIFINYIYGYV